MTMMQPATPVPSETVAMELETLGIVEMIMNQLEGKIYDPTTNSYREFGTKLVNEMGAKSIATVLGTYLSRDKMLSVLTEDEIKETTQEMCDALRMVLTLNYKEFGLGKPNLATVMAIIEHSVYINLKRSLGGRTLDHIQNMMHISETDKEKGFKWPRMTMPFSGAAQQAVEGEQ